MVESILAEIERIPLVEHHGRITAVRGLLLECTGTANMMVIGDRCQILQNHGDDVLCEVVGFVGETALLMPFSSRRGRPRCQSEVVGQWFGGFSA